MSQHPVIRDIEASYRRKDLPAFRPGDTVRVHTLIKEGDKERVQVFEGVVIDRTRRRLARLLHRPQDLLRRRRRAHLPAAQHAASRRSR